MTEQPEAQVERETSPAPEYCPPALIELGTLGDLTRGGVNQPTTDGIEGHS